jgi:hypothetical protein
MSQRRVDQNLEILSAFGSGLTVAQGYKGAIAEFAKQVRPAPGLGETIAPDDHRGLVAAHSGAFPASKEEAVQSGSHDPAV